MLLLGAGGMLGGAVYRILSKKHNVTACVRSGFDILERKWADLPLESHDWVINAAGLIPRRNAAAEQSWIVNATFPQALAAACLQADTRLVHISTDCVFASGHGPHDENAQPDAKDTYGRSKFFGEPNSAMVIRTSIVGPERVVGQNLICWALAQREMDGYTNHLWNGVSTWAVAHLIDRFLERNFYIPGLFHLHGETVTKYDLLRLVCDLWRHDAVIRPVEAAIARDQRLATCKIDLAEFMDLPPLRTQLHALMLMSDAHGCWKDQALLGKWKA